jgi:hypothetical protein
MTTTYGRGDESPGIGNMTITPSGVAKLNGLKRARQIAAIHAAADFLARNPSIEVESIILFKSTHASDEIDEALRVKPVVDLADQVSDVDLTEDADKVTARLVISNTDGLRISYSRTAYLNRYLSGAGKYVKKGSK